VTERAALDGKREGTSLKKKVNFGRALISYVARGKRKKEM